MGEVDQLCLTPCNPMDCSPPDGFSRQEYWSGLPFPSPGDLPNPGIEPRSPALQADALTSEPPRKPAGGSCQEDPLEKGVAAHSSLLAWRIPDRGAWEATVRRVAESQTPLSD